MAMNDLEPAVLNLLVAGKHPILDALRGQLPKLSVSTRNLTGVGFFTTFDRPQTDPSTPAVNLVFGDVEASFAGLSHGAGFVLFVESGKLHMLEGYTYDEKWPASARSFTLRYLDPTRREVL